MELPIITSPLSHFKEQFTFVPEIKNNEILLQHSKVIVCGMGGSAISVTLLKLFFPELSITLHNSYGLPTNYDKENSLIIINSYSGNTEEELDSFERAKKDEANMCVLSLGGTLIERVKALGGAYVQLPESSLEPRFSIGHQMIGLLTLMGETEKIAMLKEKAEHIDLPKLEALGNELGQMFNGKCPVIYSSANLYPVAYLIKTAINEGAKVPSFTSQIPEANHNELQSFITDDSTNASPVFGFLFLVSTYDHLQILKRFSIMEEMYTGKGFTLKAITADHTDILKILEVILTGYYMATAMATAKNIDPYKTPFIAEFKKKMSEQ
jgi:bifunctional phosphoglucose/phosphomannose isomerase